MLAAPSVTPSETRERIVCGMNAAVAEKGYGATTIADVVRHARVSKRTFYEHFADKLDCFLAAYDGASDHVLGAMASAASQPSAWEARVDRTVAAYLDAMAARPELTRTFLVEVLGAGPRALAHRRTAMSRFAEALERLGAALREEEPALRRLDHALATAVVGGVNELVLVAVEQGRARELAELRAPAAALVRAALAADAVPSPAASPEPAAPAGAIGRSRPDPGHPEARP